MSISDNLINKTDDELAKYQAEMRGRSDIEILIEKDWERRARIKQHELDIKLMARQIRATRFAAILGVIATIIGAIFGAILEPWLKYKVLQKPPEEKQPITQEEISSSSAAKPLDHSQNTKTILQGQTKEKDV
jgi:hypothetical protein